MRIPFYKMQGTGNDFIIINNLELQFSGEKLAQLAKKLCQRKLSIGADALMAVDQATGSEDFRMRFYNADGTEAEMCGNGARCIARYAYEKELAPAEMVIETIAGPVKAWRINETVYKVQLNSPTKVIQDLPVDVDPKITTIDYVELGDPGIPHIVAAYPDLEKADLKELWALGNTLRSYPAFEKGANVNFYEQQDDVVIRTFERGVEDFTLACGTGSGSTAFILKQKGVVKSPVKLSALGGELQVAVEENDLYLSGETKIVAIGEATPEALS